jgi:hypothetical protein
VAILVTFGRQAHVLALGGSCSLLLLSSTTTTSCLFPPFEPLDLRLLRILVAPTVLSLSCSLAFASASSVSRFASASLPPLLSALVFGSSCIVGGFLKVQNKGQVLEQFTCEAPFRLAGHAPSLASFARHCSNTHALYTFCLGLQGQRRPFSSAAPVRAELRISTPLESRVSENYRE